LASKTKPIAAIPAINATNNRAVERSCSEATPGLGMFGLSESCEMMFTIDHHSLKHTASRGTALQTKIGVSA